MNRTKYTKKHLTISEIIFIIFLASLGITIFIISIWPKVIIHQKKVLGNMGLEMVRTAERFYNNKEDLSKVGITCITAEFLYHGKYFKEEKNSEYKNISGSVLITKDNKYFWISDNSFVYEKVAYPKYKVKNAKEGRKVSRLCGKFWIKDSNGKDNYCYWDPKGMTCQSGTFTDQGKSYTTF